MELTQNNSSVAFVDLKDGFGDPAWDVDLKTLKSVLGCALNSVHFLMPQLSM